MKHRIISLLACALFAQAFGIAFGQTVSNVRALQEGDKIAVYYHIDKPAKNVQLTVSTDGGKTFSSPLVQVSGDVGSVQGGERKIVWDPLAEYNGLVGDNIVFNVSCGGKSNTDIRYTDSASGQVVVKKSPKVKFLFELGIGGGVTAKIKTIYDRELFGGGLLLYGDVGVLINKNYIAAEFRAPSCKATYNASTITYTGTTPGLRYRYNWESGIFLGGFCGYDFGSGYINVSAEIGYSFFKWLNIKANVGYPEIVDFTVGFNIANIFYK